MDEQLVALRQKKFPPIVNKTWGWWCKLPNSGRNDVSEMSSAAAPKIIF